jgi:mRNA interferase MazF
MTSTISYKQWDIILVQFPFTDFQSSKKRPALVISPDLYNSDDDLIILFITSQLDRTSRPGDYFIKEWKAANLPKPSMIRMKMATITQPIVDKQLGRLSAVDISSFKSHFREFFLE